MKIFTVDYQVVAPGVYRKDAETATLAVEDRDDVEGVLASLVKLSGNEAIEVLSVRTELGGRDVFAPLEPSPSVLAADEPVVAMAEISAPEHAE